MTIRRKTALVFLAALGSILLVLGVASRFVLVRGFEDIEREALRRDADRAGNALALQLARLRASARDYAAWDDTFRFMAEPSAEYLAANYLPSTLQNLEVGFIILAHADGRAAFAVGYDAAAQKLAPLDPAVLETLARDGLLPAPGRPPEAASGVLRLSRGPALVAAEPILTSQGRGPARGLLFMGRDLDDAAVDQIGRTTLLEVRQGPAPAAPAPSGPRPALADADGARITLASEERIESEIPVFDVRGAPALTLTVAKDRAIYRKAVQSLNTFAALLVLTGVACFGFAGLVLERTVLRRIAGLHRDVSGIRESRDITRRAATSGRDEISDLGREINRMLDTLEQMDAARQRTADDLRAANLAAERANRAKGAFLAAMSHEIRTPLNAVIGLSELALCADRPGKLREYLGDIRSSAATLLELVDDILDFSRIEAGSLALESAALDLNEVARRTANLFRERMAAKGLRFSTRVDPALSSPLLGDATRLQQVLVNLVANACKFTEIGEVILSVEAVESSPAAATARFTVRDTGIGIAPGAQEGIFSPFRQADNSTTRKYGGAGLGLAISRDLVALMGGRLEVESAPGRGSRFSFTLSLPRAESAPAPPARPVLDMTALAGARVLLAEDNAFNRKVARDMLRGLGLEVATAETGTEAVLALYQEDFDALLLDLRMPEMDGLEAARLIRSEDRFRSLPIIAFTANVLGEDREACLAAGMNDFLAKPVSMSRLAETLVRWIAPREGRAALLPEPDSAPAPPPVPAGLKGLDLARGLEVFAGDAAALDAAVLSFPAHFVDAAPQIRRALDLGDRVAAGRLAHSLKAAAAQIGAADLARAARDVETAADRAEDSLARSLADNLEQALHGLVEAILAHAEARSASLPKP